VDALRGRMTIWLAVLLMAIIGAIVAFQMTTSSGAGPKVLHGRLLTDPKPTKGKDCPYPPPGSYGSGKSGKVAPGRDKHCND
jgi:hypothetical protein